MSPKIRTPECHQKSQGLASCMSERLISPEIMRAVLAPTRMFNLNQSRNPFKYVNHNASFLNCYYFLFIISFVYPSEPVFLFSDAKIWRFRPSAMNFSLFFPLSMRHKPVFCDIFPHPFQICRKTSHYRSTSRIVRDLSKTHDIIIGIIGIIGRASSRQCSQQA